MGRHLLDEIRDTSLEVVAACAENYYRAKCQFEGSRPFPDSDQPRGDFLYDVVRMQLSHLNELARLSAAYSFIPARILERLYASGGSCSPRGEPLDTRCAPKPEYGSGKGLRRDASGGDTTTYQFKIRNVCKTEQTATILPFEFKDRATGKADGNVRFTISVDEKPCDSNEFTFKDAARVQVHVTLSPDIGKGLTLDARVNVAYSNADPQSFCLVLCTQE